MEKIAGGDQGDLAGGGGCDGGRQDCSPRGLWRGEDAPVWAGIVPQACKRRHGWVLRGGGKGMAQTSSGMTIRPC